MKNEMGSLSQSTERLITQEQAEKERLFKVEEKRKAKRYVTRYAERYQWLGTDLETVVGCLGLDEEPERIMDLVNPKPISKRG